MRNAPSASELVPIAFLRAPATDDKKTTMEKNLWQRSDEQSLFKITQYASTRCVSRGFYLILHIPPFITDKTRRYFGLTA